SRERGATLFMVLMAAFQVLLARWSGQGDISVGTPVANRNRGEVEPLIGFFINTLVLRSDLADDPTFAVLVDRVREAALGAYAHQDVPFEKLVEALGASRDLGRTPLFQAMFGLQNAPMSALELPGLTLTPVPVDAGAAKFELELSLAPEAGALAGTLVYNADLFDAATVASMAQGFEVLLRGVIAEPEGRVAALPLLDEATRRRVLGEGNGTAAVAPARARVHQRFQAQAAATPDALALVSGSERLTYRALDRRANQLARHLRALGVGPEVRVAICLDRSVEMVVALLAVLEAGGAYVPLDPGHPRARIDFLLEDCRATVVLTRRRWADALGAGAARVICLDELADALARESDEPLAAEVDGRHAAYVIYTSGSTGQPKGVLVEHRGLSNLVEAQIEAFGVTPETPVLQFASFGFDASVSEIFTALQAGAALHLASSDDLLPGPDLLRLLEERAIAVVTLPPSALAVLPAAALPALRTLVVAGEACAADLVDRWAPGRRFINAYGPTEATVCATLAVCAAGERPLIGGPLPGVRVHVLDPAGSLAPLGAPGELYIGGVG
ncbi:MAG: AMP-binding protein, partial [Byssovorax sp.]